MKYRKVRIAWSVGWGIVCLLLIELWVRSYTSLDDTWIPLPFKNDLGVTSQRGVLHLSLFPRDLTYPGMLGWTSTDVNALPPSKVSFVWGVTRGNAEISVPTWSVVVLTATVGALPWMRWRFSLRTLLITITLAALALGLIIATTR